MDYAAILNEIKLNNYLSWEFISILLGLCIFMYSSDFQPRSQASSFSHTSNFDSHQLSLSHQESTYNRLDRPISHNSNVPLLSRATSYDSSFSNGSHSTQNSSNSTPTLQHMSSPDSSNSNNNNFCEVKRQQFPPTIQHSTSIAESEEAIYVDCSGYWHPRESTTGLKKCVHYNVLATSAASHAA